MPCDLVFYKHHNCGQILEGSRMLKKKLRHNYHNVDHSKKILEDHSEKLYHFYLQTNHLEDFLLVDQAVGIQYSLK